jgi:phospholipid/cholesterol/gamma-HCH transport system substrate-binding protein
MRFDRTNGYTAEFTNISGLRSGQFVRASGVEIGKVSAVRLVDGGRRAQVDFSVDRSVPLYQSTTAQIRYLNLIGDRYLELKRGEGEGSDRVLPPDGFIPVARTSPALDLDALIGGFKPLFRALDPDKVNTIASALITVFQGQGGTINDILDNTAQLTNQLGERDQELEHRARHDGPPSPAIRPNRQQPRGAHHWTEGPRRLAGRRDSAHQQCRGNRGRPAG